MTATNPLMQTLAWSLLHFLWQGAAIAAVGAAFMFVLRQPATRYLVGIAALTLMLASFAVTFALISSSPGTAADSAAVTLATTSHLAAPANSVKQFVTDQAANNPAIDFLWIARGWLAGVFVFALRIAFGLLLLEHLRRRNLIALPVALVEKFGALQRRLGIRRAIRYCECQLLRVPAVIGFLRPIVLLPMRAMTGLSAEQLEAVVAHELGHIKRFDVVVNFFQVIAETLFFFHPAVWWLNKRIRADREDCCDDVAIAACGGTVGYARALATMEGWRDAPDFAMAATGSPVAVRVARLLGVSRHTSGTRTAGVVTASLVLATALLAGAVSIGVANPARAQTTGETVEHAAKVGRTEEAQEAIEAEEAAEAEQAVEAEEAIREEKAQRAEKPERAEKPPRAPKPPREPKAPHAAKPPTAPAAAPTAPVSAPTATVRDASFIKEMRVAGLDNLDVDQVVALKVHGITSEYIREIRSTRLDPDVNVLVAMKIQGVTPTYVKDIRSLGFEPNADDLVAMKIHDVTPAYVKAMRDLGIEADAREMIEMKIQDVTPEYVRQMRAAGFNPNTQELIAMKIQNVTPEYRKALEGAGYKLNVSELIEAKVMDITPEFAKQASAHGFKNLSIGKLIQLKIADVL